MKIVREHNYSSVYMKAKKCIVKSRSECDISIMLGNRKFRNPMIPADMPAVVDFNTCETFAKMNMFYVMHRFGINDEDLISFIRKMNKEYDWSSISVGIKDSDKNLIQKLSMLNICPTYVNIDIAHAYSDACVDMINYIKSQLPGSFIIAGNVASVEAVNFLYNNGADAVRIFIAPGSGCSTKNATGFYRGSIEFINECYLGSDCPIIADGGITEPGDICKAVGAGAYMVMMGGVLAGHDESPGNIITVDGKKKYCYYGNASFMNKGVKKHIEGKDYLIDPRGPLVNTVKLYEDGLVSAVSYSGKSTIRDMCGNCEFIEIVK